MESEKQIEKNKATAQVIFDSVVNEAKGQRLVPETWNRLFSIIYKAERFGLSLETVSPMTMFNYKQWKKANA